jgi:Domain of unknown function (DUF1905).
MDKVKYEFSAKTYQYSSTDGMCGWTFVSLPKELSAEIRDSFKHLEEGWGRMNVTAKLGGSEWQTAIWFDTKQDTYLLPLKVKIRKQEKVILGEDVKILILV